MSTLSAAAQNAATNAITALVDAAATPGRIRFLTAGLSVLAAADLPDPAFNAAIAGTADLAAAVPGIAVTATGTAEVYQITDGDGTVIITGTVGLTGTGADIEFASVSWSSGDAVDLATFTHTTPAN